MKTGKEVQQFTGHGERIRSLAISRDGKRLLSGSWDKTARVWDVNTGAELRRFDFEGNPGKIESAVFTPDGRRVLIATGKILRLLDAGTGQEIHVFTGHQGGVLSVALTSDGRRALSGGYDKTLRLWDMATGRQIASYAAHRNWIWTVSFSPDGRHMLSAGGGMGNGGDSYTPGDDFALRLWPTPAEERTASATAPPAR